MSIIINQQTIANNEPVFFIAEIGSNHDSKIEQAKKLIDECAAMGANAVKFQSFSADKLVSRTHPAFSALQKLELPEAWHDELADYCRHKDILFLSTPFDEEKVDWLERCGVAAYKVASGDITYTRLLERLAKTGKPLILATGICTLQDVQDAVRHLKANGNPPLALLHCVSNYPPRDEDINLHALTVLQQQFPELVLGLSDHSSGDTAVLGAVALGARIIEKHITFSRNLSGPDHGYAMEVQEFAAMIRQVRRLQTMLGSAEKKPVTAEKDELIWARRGIYLQNNLPRGHVLSEQDLAYLRPNMGLSANHYHTVIGRQLTTDVQAGDMLLADQVGE